jgi:hypothetical protein
MSCDNVKAGSQLEIACNCKKASDALASLVDTYNRQYEEYSKRLANHNKSRGEWENNHSNWRRNRDIKKNELGNHDHYAGCGACRSNPDCPGGWTWAGNNNNCHASWLPGTGCERVCRRTDEQIERDMSGWYGWNPEPSEPKFNENPPIAPSGNNVQCCTQLFSGIKADSVNFKNIQQECNQMINDMVKSSPSSGGSQGAPPGAPPGAGNNNKVIIGIGVVSLVVIAMVIVMMVLMFMMDEDSSDGINVYDG